MHPELGRRAEVPSAAVRHGHFAYPRQRLQGSPGLGRPAPLHDREVGRGGAAAQVAHVLQPPGPAAVQDVRGADAEVDLGGGGDGGFRTGIDWKEKKKKTMGALSRNGGLYTSFRREVWRANRSIKWHFITYIWIWEKWLADRTISPLFLFAQQFTFCMLDRMNDDGMTDRLNISRMLARSDYDMCA